MFNVRKGQRKTDMCDHCHLYRSKTLPQYWADVKETRAELEAKHPGMFDAFDEDPAVKKALVDDPLVYAELYLQHITNFIDEHRAEIPYGNILGLKKAIDAVKSLLGWSIQLLRSCAWHVRLTF